MSSPFKLRSGNSPLKKKGGIKGVHNTVQSTAKKFGSDFKTSIDKGASKIGLNKTGDIGAKMKSKYSSSAQRANKVARPGESQFQFKNRTRKSKSKSKVKTGTPTVKKKVVKKKVVVPLGASFKPSALSPSNINNAKLGGGATSRVSGIGRSGIKRKKNTTSLGGGTIKANPLAVTKTTKTPKTPKTTKVQKVKKPITEVSKVTNVKKGFNFKGTRTFPTKKF
jgi:hypothetical protein